MAISGMNFKANVASQERYEDLPTKFDEEAPAIPMRPSWMSSDDKTLNDMYLEIFPSVDAFAHQTAATANDYFGSGCRKVVV